MDTKYVLHSMYCEEPAHLTHRCFAFKSLDRATKKARAIMDQVDDSHWTVSDPGAYGIAGAVCAWSDVPNSGDIVIAVKAVDGPRC